MGSHLGATSKNEGGRSEEAESKHDERNALVAQNACRRGSPGCERTLQIKNPRVGLLNLAKVPREFLTGITTKQRYLKFAGPKNEEVAQID